MLVIFAARLGWLQPWQYSPALQISAYIFFHFPSFRFWHEGGMQSVLGAPSSVHLQGEEPLNLAHFSPQRHTATMEPSFSYTPIFNSRLLCFQFFAFPVWRQMFSLFSTTLEGKKIVNSLNRLWKIKGAFHVRFFLNSFATPFLAVFRSSV